MRTKNRRNRKIGEKQAKSKIDVNCLNGDRNVEFAQRRNGKAEDVAEQIKFTERNSSGTLKNLYF